MSSCSCGATRGARGPKGDPGPAFGQGCEADAQAFYDCAPSTFRFSDDFERLFAAPSEQVWQAVVTDGGTVAALGAPPPPYPPVDPQRGNGWWRLTAPVGGTARISTFVPVPVPSTAPAMQAGALVTFPAANPFTGNAFARVGVTDNPASPESANAILLLTNMSLSDWQLRSAVAGVVEASPIAVARSISCTAPNAIFTVIDTDPANPGMGGGVNDNVLFPQRAGCFPSAFGTAYYLYAEVSAVGAASPVIMDIDLFQAISARECRTVGGTYTC